MEETITMILMRRDGMTKEEAEELINDAVEQLTSYLDDGDYTSVEDICAEFFGLEEDYIHEIYARYDDTYVYEQRDAEDDTETSEIDTFTEPRENERSIFEAEEARGINNGWA